MKRCIHSLFILPEARLVIHNNLDVTLLLNSSQITEGFIRSQRELFSFGNTVLEFLLPTGASSPRQQTLYEVGNEINGTSAASGRTQFCSGRLCYLPGMRITKATS